MRTPADSRRNQRGFAQQAAGLDGPPEFRCVNRGETARPLVVRDAPLTQCLGEVPGETMANVRIREVLSAGTHLVVKQVRGRKDNDTTCTVRIDDLRHRELSALFPGGQLYHSWADALARFSCDELLVHGSPILVGTVKA